ncbi:hypothetical protein [uncultured Hymenobacter sp.]|uniref:hypothetical protein n=1 Tax=uncultured Hymenobacter sp. TaxID=170016 RepID=UPI0035CA608E
MRSSSVPTPPRPVARRLAGLSLLGGLLLSGCGIREQVQQAKAFKDVDVRLASVTQATVAGIDVTQMRQPADLSAAQRATIAGAYASGNLPLRMLVNLELRNPNPETAALNELDYLALLDGRQFATGRTTERVEVAGNGGVAQVPVTLESNLREALGEQSAASIAGFALGLADRERAPMRLTLRLRPTFITSGGRRIAPAGYVNVEKEFTAQQVREAVQRRP